MREHAAEAQAVIDQRDTAIRERDDARKQTGLLLKACYAVRNRLIGMNGGFHSEMRGWLNDAIAQVEIADGSRALPGTESQSTAATNDS